MNSAVEETELTYGSLKQYQITRGLSINAYWEIVKSNLDVFGETLRQFFFKQTEDRLGCYDVFDVREGVEKLPDDDSIYNPANNWICWMDVWHCFQLEIPGLGLVKMRYSWDGDGVLEFHFPDGQILENGDCKKTYGWKYIKY